MTRKKLQCFTQYRSFFSENSYLYISNYLTMGRGDKKTAKGKRFKGSFGKSRPAKKAVAKKAAAKKA
ncbi:MAG: 30S ribosomal protein THX [Chitinophagaceae bacterium]|nr:30S ribosomal protein THX [Chitinophagaceae bacterium]